MKILRKLLFPFAFMYGGIMSIRNYLYDSGFLRSTSYSFPVISVGNLSVGGTGKTPMIEYLLTLLKQEYQLATLSRGYGRKTRGFLAVTGNESPVEVGDEPLQFKKKFPDITVVVDENRVRGIALLKEKFDPEVVLLDDAFQHRKVTPGLNILLTTYGNLYSNDFMLPTGDLREPKSGAERADIIVVTKGPGDLSDSEQQQIKRKLKVKEHQELFFSYIAYAEKVINERKEILLKDLSCGKITLVTGIANPEPLCQYLVGEGVNFDHLDYPDHHAFTKNDLEKISKATVVLTTEKDFMRLKYFKHKDIYYIPIQVRFIGGSSKFDAEIKKFILK